MNHVYQRVMAAWFFMFTLGLTMARAETQTWTTATGDWSAVANWTNWASPAASRVPEAGDDVFITNAGAYAILTNSTPWLSSLVISNSNVIMSFSNWDTMLYVTNLTICQGATQTCAGPFTNTAVSNRVNLTCSNLVIKTNGSINVKGKGFSGGYGSGFAAGHGPGGYFDSGGGYGGAGASRGYLTPGTVYGSAEAPLAPGSGGACYVGGSDVGGHGGGAVRINAAQVVVNGSINADSLDSTGASPYTGYGGAGGGIYITCSTITGTNGTITAKGGLGRSDCAGGGGGRIAIVYNPAAQSNVPMPSLVFSAMGVYSSYTRPNYSDIGTLYFPDNYFFSPTNLFNGQWMVPGFTNLSLADWTVTNVWIRLPAAGFSLTVTNTLTVVGTDFIKYKLELTNGPTVSCGQCRISGATLGLGSPTYTERFSCTSSASAGPTLICSGDLTLTNSSGLYIAAGLTNAAGTGYGAWVNVGGDIRVASNSWIYPDTHPTNGTPVLFNIRNLTLDRYGGINADYRGYAGSLLAQAAYGPGAPPHYRGGAGYGGMGGTGFGGPAGSAYGSSNAPVDPGSGARGGTDNSYVGGAGGGSVQIRANKTVTIEGTITANGGAGVPNYAGGASGGGIYITCRTFIGSSNGVLWANGGNGHYSLVNAYGGGGGGGRIAVWCTYNNSPSVISNYVNGGTNTASSSTGTNGTVVWGWIPPAGTIISVH